MNIHISHCVQKSLMCFAAILLINCRAFSQSTEIPMVPAVHNTNALANAVVVDPPPTNAIDTQGALDQASRTNDPVNRLASSSSSRAGKNEPIVSAAQSPNTVFHQGNVHIVGADAVGDFGPHKVHFKANLLNQFSIDQTMADGQELKSGILGLYYTDTRSGLSVKIASIQDASGQILPSGQVLYSNAFSGVKADVLYTYSANSLEQDIVIRRQLPPPSRYNFDAAFVRLSVITEFNTSQDPITAQRRNGLLSNQLSGNSTDSTDDDEMVIFPSMRMVPGKAFTLGDSTTEIPVSKRWMKINGKKFLIESTMYSLIKNQIDNLPPDTAQVMPRESHDLKLMLAQAGEYSPARYSNSTFKLAQAMPRQPGVVLDYLIATTPMLNINFGAYSTNKLGFAAVGQTTNDFWNGYRFPGSSLAVVTNLYWSDSTVSTIGLIVSNATGQWNNPVSDGMYSTYSYHSGGGLVVLMTNLSAGVYDFFIYGHGNANNQNGIYQLTSGTNSYGTSATTSVGTNSWNSTVWQEGVQYVVFRNVTVSSNQPITISVSVDGAGYAMINGIQVVPDNPATTISSLLNMNFGDVSSGKTGRAAIGTATNDCWNGLLNSYYAAGTNLLWADGIPSHVGVSMTNAPGQWGFSSFDSMYSSYVYPWNGGNIAISTTNLPTGRYDFYVYGHGNANNQSGLFDLSVAGTDFGTKQTVNGSDWSRTNWSEGSQYVVFRSIWVTNGQPVSLTVLPGVSGYAIINGLQIVAPMAADLTPPTITGQPQSHTNCAGDSVTLSVSVTGSGPFSYLWSKNGIYLSGATNSSFVFTNVSSANAGNYSVVVGNPSGAFAVSSAAVITINPLPTAIVSGTATIAYSDSTNIQAILTGTGPWSLLWSDGTNQTVTSPPPAVRSVSPSSTTTYTLVSLSDSHCSANPTGLLGTALITVLPKILTQPLNQTAILGSNVTFSVSVIPTNGVNYQWMHAGTNIAGASNSAFSISVVSTNYAGAYSVAVTGLGGNVVSSNAILTVLVPPAISIQPISQSLFSGSNVIFGVTATGTSPLSYQWFFGSNPIVDQTNATLSLPNIQHAIEGSYFVMVSNAAGSVLSDSALLVINKLRIDPGSQTNNVGSNIVFHAIADGTVSHYQWTKNGIDLTNNSRISGATAANLTISNAVGPETGNFTDSGLYSVSVLFVDGTGAQAKPAWLYIRAPKTKQPGTPSGVRARVTGSGPYAILEASCRPNRIVLDWTIPNTTTTYANLYILRSSSPTGPFSPLLDSDGKANFVNTTRQFIDTSVTVGSEYYYMIGGNNEATDMITPLSDTVSQSTCNTPIEGPFDIAFIVDNTGSMGPSLQSIKNAINDVLENISIASQSDYRLALVTPDDHDIVDVRVPFAQNNIANFRAAILDKNFIASGGVGTSESTDECLNTIVNGLTDTAHGRTDSRDCKIPGSDLQKNNFAPNFRPNVHKIVILITDATPGGFCDALSDSGSHAHTYASEAANQGIQINSILVYDQNADAQDAVPIMQDYASTTCGWYNQIDAAGVGVADAILRMLYSVGQCTVTANPPTADSQTVNTDCSATTGITLTGKASNNGALSYTKLINPSHGSLTGTLPNLTYTPSTGYFGPDYFTFKVNDGSADSIPGYVSINVNNLVEGVDDSYSVYQGGANLLNVLANDVDQYSTGLTINSVTQPLHGSVSISSDHKTVSYTYTPTYQNIAVSTPTVNTGESFVVVAVNKNGLACGYLVTADGKTHASTWDTSSGAVYNLDPDGTYSIAESINDNGNVVGYFDSGSGVNHAFKIISGVWTDIHSAVASSGYNTSYAYGVNKSGQICGNAHSTSFSKYQAFAVDSDGTVRHLDPYGNSTMDAWAINDSGLIAGDSELPSTYLDAITWQPGNSPTDLGSRFSVPNQWAYGINSYGDIAGETGLYSYRYAFIIQNGIFQDLSDGYADSYAVSINSQGQVVGAWTDLSVDYDYRALYWKGNQHVDLNSLLAPASGWILKQPTSINENGLIVGVGTYQGHPTSFAVSAPTFVNEDSFTYTVADGTCNGTANVQVNVLDKNPIQLQNDYPTVLQNQPQIVNVLANDTDLLSGRQLNITSVGQGAHGSVTINGNTVTYNPTDQNYVGLDQFSYTVSDGIWTATAEVNVTIINPVQPKQDDVTVFDNTGNVINVLVNDTDLSGGSLTITSFTSGQHGTVAYSADHKSLVYTPGVTQLSLHTPTLSANQQFSVASVNNTGMACGSLSFSGGATHAALWEIRSGTVTDVDPSGTYSVAQSINDNGTVVGYEDVGGGIYHAFKYSSGQMTDLHSQVAGVNFTHSYAYGVNNNEQICGKAFSSSTSLNQAFFINSANNVMHLDPFGNHLVEAHGLNNHGLVVGDSAVPSGYLHAITWQPGNTPTDCGSDFTIPNQWGLGINAQGDIVGYTELYYNIWAYVIQNGVFKDLSEGYPDSYASAINSKGQIVGGWTSQYIGFTDRALYWEGSWNVDLNTLLATGSGWILEDPSAINENGLIVGNGVFNGQPCAFAVQAPSPYVGSDSFTYAVSDGTWTGTATVNTKIGGQPVTASAGANQSIRLSDKAILNGNASDVNPLFGPFTYLWTKVSGPGVVSFDNPNAQSTGARFDTPGIYVLRLAVTDTRGSFSADVQITVSGNTDLMITQQPVDQTGSAYDNNMVYFNIQASGGVDDIGYEWIHNGQTVGVGDYLEIDPADDGVEGAYYVRVTDGTTTLSSSTVTLNVSDAVTAPDGLAAWWPGENTGIDNTGQHNGTLSAVTFALGKVGQAFSFNGTSSKIIIPDSTSLAFTQNMTIEGWINPLSFNHSYVILRGNNQTGVNPYYLSVESGGILRFYIDSGTANDHIDASISLNQWSHIAAVLNDSAGTISLYVNGTLINSKTTSVRPFLNLTVGSGAAIGIGNHPSSNQNAPFYGLIDELSLYSTALSEASIIEIANAAVGKLPVGISRLPIVSVNTVGTGTLPSAVTFLVPNYPDAKIYYSLDGSIPNEYTAITYTGSITISQPTTIIAYATMPGFTDSPKVVQKYGTAYSSDTTRFQGNNQVGDIRNQLLVPLVANFTSGGSPFADNQPVTFTALSPSGLDVSGNLSKTTDVTGSDGTSGHAFTMFTLGDELGKYTVTAHCQSQDIQFESEAISGGNAVVVDDGFNLAPGGGKIIETGAFLLASASVVDKTITHIMPFLLNTTGSTSQIGFLEETAPGSGVFIDMSDFSSHPNSITSLSLVSPLDTTSTLPPTCCDWNTLNSFSWSSADLVANQSQSTFNDSDGLDREIQNNSDDGYFDSATFLGAARSVSGQPPIAGYRPMTRQSLKDAGFITTGQVTLRGKTFPIYTASQANLLYISTHGHSATSGISAIDGQLVPMTDLANGEWRKGLCTVIIAGCTVLDVTGSKWSLNVSDGSTRRKRKHQSDPLPGYDWINTGPGLFCGYEGVGPADKAGDIGNKIAIDFVDYMTFGIAATYGSGSSGTTFDPGEAWIQANLDHFNDTIPEVYYTGISDGTGGNTLTKMNYNKNIGDSCGNAAVIYVCHDPRYVLHFKSVGGKLSKDIVPESAWQKRGQP